ncbi:ComEC/Rec2 family competence protein [Methylobrevis albus]|uniref:ComEC/Rec2 family competence protein n=1 Tax=Methylobrevis albus TaxID=2793297 RepID=A0A931I3Z5_9HYPH|nr:ComEC/Rec2 family competence protein [Methylobrevis albus]MBH0239820.1 ComEC/Rec2 family competence protein [Methylobrevis albus]
MADGAAAGGERGGGLRRALPAPTVARLDRRLRLLRAEGRRLAAEAAADLGNGRDFLWFPVAFASGIFLYFAWPGEPGAAAGAVAALLAAAALVVRHRATTIAPGFLAIFALLAALGFLHAKLATAWHHAPRVEAPRTAAVLGHVESYETRDNGGRITLRTVAVSGYAAADRPQRLQIAVRGGSAPLPGSAVSLRARLQPPSGPLVPGGYDFARRAYFLDIAGNGFAIGDVAAWTPAPPAPWDVRAVAALERFRFRVAAHIRSVLPGDPGAIAAALMVGDRGAITPEADEAMRISGLSHILSISGLHMTLVTAAIYGTVRALLAAIPAIALAWPVKQIAAGVGLVGALAYLAVSGLSIPTQRSAVTTSLVLLAVILGRPAISLRLVAVAALVVMLLRPEAVLDPGAQMSFAAVAALVAGFEWWTARRARQPAEPDASPLVRGLGTAARWVGGLAATSLIAGLATTPIALHHFDRLAPLSLVANLVAAPIVSFVVMPAGLVAALAMPLGLDGWPLILMGQGVEAMLWTAEEVAAVTPAGGVLRGPPLAATVAFVMAGLWCVLWSGRLRLFCLAPLAAGVLILLVAGEREPDVLVSGAGTRVMLRGADGDLVLVGRAGGLETELMLRAFGDPRAPGDRALTRRTGCDPSACIMREERDEAHATARGRARSGAGRLPADHAVVAPGARSGEWEGEGQDDGGATETGPAEFTMAVVRRPDAFAEECRRNAVVVTPLDAPRWCADTAAVIDRTILAEHGAVALRALPGAMPRFEIIDRSRPAEPRPWTPASGLP